jgi:protein-S-isoprenylcysteine O-methyltransferase Ste14
MAEELNPADFLQRLPIELSDSTPKKSPIERYRGVVNVLLYSTILLSCILSDHHKTSFLTYELIETLGYLFVGVAILGRLWCGIYLFGKKSKKLCMDGPYSVCRNPLYLFSGMTIVGVGAQSFNIAVMVAVAVIFSGYYYFVIKREERRLETLFGDEYKKYCRAVPRIIPRFRNYQTPETIELPVHVFLPLLARCSWSVFLIGATQLINVLKENGGY